MQDLTSEIDVLLVNADGIFQSIKVGINYQMQRANIGYLSCSSCGMCACACICINIPCLSYSANVFCVY